MKKRIIVPRDLRKKAALGILWKVIKFAIALYITYVFIDLIYQSLSKTDIGNVSGTVFVILVIPFIYCRFPMNLIDRDWYGEVIGFETKNNEYSLFDKRDKIDPFEIHAIIRETGGKLHMCRIYDEGQSNTNCEKLYRVGEKVVHIYGMEYLVPIRENKNLSTLCAYCGSKHPVGTKLCSECGCSMEIIIEDSVKGKKK